MSVRRENRSAMSESKSTFKFGRPHFKTWPTAEPIFAPTLAEALNEVKNHADQSQLVTPGLNVFFTAGRWDGANTTLLNFIIDNAELDAIGDSESFLKTKMLEVASEFAQSRDYP
jgi:hypothetical protein